MKKKTKRLNCFTSGLNQTHTIIISYYIIFLFSWVNSKQTNP